MKSIKLTIIAMLWAWASQAQRDPLYGLYMNNPQAINPAYAGYHNWLTANVNYRLQWANLDVHPETFTASINGTLSREYAGGGLLVIQDKIGAVTNSETYLMSSYKIEGGDFRVSFGLQAGIVNQRYDFSSLNLDPDAMDDPTFQSSSPITKLNFGAGILFSTRHTIFGASVPRFSQPILSSNENRAVEAPKTIYLMGAHVFTLEADTYMKPSVLIRLYESGRPSFDGGVTWIGYDLFNIGMFTRDLKSYGLQVGMGVGPAFKINYGVEFTAMKTGNMDYLTHEVNIQLNLAVFHFHKLESSHF